MERRLVRPACRTRSSRWPATSSTASTSRATSACSTPAAAPAASPRSCSSGVPDGQRVAVDGSAAMVEQASERLGDDVEAFAQDLLELTLDAARRRDPLDRDLPLDRRPRAALRAPARRAEAGRAARRPVRRLRATSPTSQEAIDAVDHPAAARLGRPVELRRRPTRRPSASRAAGFTDVWTWLQPWPVEPAGPARVLHDDRSSARTSSASRPTSSAPFVDAVLAQLGAARCARTTCGSTSSPGPDRRAPRRVPRTSIHGSAQALAEALGHPPAQVLAVAQAVLHERDVVAREHRRARRSATRRSPRPRPVERPR